MEKRIVNALMCIAIISLLVIAGCSQQGITGRVIGSPEKCVKQESYNVQVPYNDTEYEWVEECLDRQEYCKDAPYTDFTVSISYFSKRCLITVNNRGDLTGDWTLRAKFITTAAGGGPTSEPITRRIGPRQSDKFEFIYGGSDMPTACVNVNDKIPIDKYCPCSMVGQKRVPKLVTKYRTETRYRNVTVDC